MPAAPRIVMVVANDVTVDTRVRKMAFGVAEAGADVTVLGLSSTGHREEAMLGSARVVRLPKVPFTAVPPRLAVRLGQEATYPGRSEAYALQQRIIAERDAFFVHQRDVGAEIGWLRRDWEAERRRRIDDANRRDAERTARFTGRSERLRAVMARGNGRGGTTGRVMAGVARRLARADLRRHERRRARAKDRLERGLTDSTDRLLAAERRLRDRLAVDHERYLARRERMAAGVAELTVARDEGTGRPSRRRRDWRDELPDLFDYEQTFGPALDDLDADVIHAHDVHLLGVAARAVGRKLAAGHDTKLLYDAHEYVQGLSRYSPRVLSAWSSLEREYIGHADHIITVSRPLAELLARDYSLGYLPDLVLNIPVVVHAGGESVRDAAGVDEDTPLVVYSGGFDPTRGVHTLVEAVGKLDGVHLALVAKAETGYVLELTEMAARGRFGDRVHVVPFVAPQHVVDYLSSATVGVHPLVSGPMNHEIALPNKLFEYMHAGLPVVVSSCRAMAGLVEELGVGEVFESENPDSLAAALDRVIADPSRYTVRYHGEGSPTNTYTWDRQLETLLDVYERLLEEPLPRSRPASGELPADRIGTAHGTVLGIGPFNMAGQGWAWAKAVEAAHPEIPTEVFEIHRPNRIAFPADVRIPGSDWRSLDWQVNQVRHVVATFSHLLLEGGSGVLGTMNGGTLVDDLPFLNEQGIRVGAVFHGSDVRHPDRHAELVASSPFPHHPALADRVRETAERNLAMLDAFDGPVFVSTLDLLDHVPGATWLPQVVDVGRWATDRAFAGGHRLRVLHSPTSRELKGGDHVIEVCERLAAEGLIDFDLVEGLPSEAMPARVADCDVLIDGIVLGLYGTTTVEGLAAGRLVLANVERVVDRLPESPPVVHVDPTTLEQALRSIAADPGEFAATADAGPAYAARYHDGRFSASQLAPFLSIDV